jgi:hypothetical protein
MVELNLTVLLLVKSELNKIGLCLEEKEVPGSCFKKKRKTKKMQ